MKKNLKGKLFGAMAALGLAVASTVGSTYAWFSMNQSVEMTGMNVKATVASNLLIASSEAGTASVGIDKFKNADTQAIEARLQPVSTTNGTSFFYTSTSNAAADGHAIADTYVAYSEAQSLANAAAIKANCDKNFNFNYGVGHAASDDPVIAEELPTASNVVYGFVDYVFELQATNTSAAVQYIDLTKLNLEYQKVGAEDGSKAFRVAYYTQKGSKSGETITYPADLTFKTLIKTAGAENFDNKAVSSTSATASVTYASAVTNTQIQVAAGETEYYKVTLRLFLEGMDKTCNNETFVKLDNTWNLDIAYKLNSTSSSIFEITKSVKSE